MRENIIGKKKKKSDDKRPKKTRKCLAVNYQEDTPLNCFMDGAIRNTIRNIRRKLKKVEKKSIFKI